MNQIKWHIICEKDVGLFSLIQQVISHIPLTLTEGRIPIVLYGSRCCYWVKEGYMGKDNVWEYYFEPIVEDYPSSVISSEILDHIGSHHPHFEYPGYDINEETFVTNHFGDHQSFGGKTLKIPHKWDDPDEVLRAKAGKIIKDFVRPRSYILEKVSQFQGRLFQDQYVIGVHMRATDVMDPEEHNIHRRGSFRFDEYVACINELLNDNPEAKIFVATDSLSALDGLKAIFGERVIHSSSIFHSSEKVTGSGPSGWVIPGYLSEDADKAAKNGEEAVIDYLLLSQCQYLIHNGSGLARTALLKNPELRHVNIHSKSAYLKQILKLGNGEILQYLKFSYRHFIHNLKKPIKRLINWDKV